MIKSKDDLWAYIVSDAKANSILQGGNFRNKLRNRFNPTWQFIIALRKYEYAKNTNNTILTIIRWFKWHRLSIKLGFTIPPNVCDSGLSLPHYGNIIINPNAHIGKNCRIHVGVNIGANGGSNLAPIIGDNVYIGPGVKIYGNIKIGDNSFIAANSVVNKSFTANSVLAGVPACNKKNAKEAWWELNKLNI